MESSQFNQLRNQLQSSSRPNIDGAGTGANQKLLMVGGGVVLLAVVATVGYLGYQKWSKSTDGELPTIEEVEDEVPEQEQQQTKQKLPRFFSNSTM